MAFRKESDYFTRCPYRHVRFEAVMGRFRGIRLRFFKQNFAHKSFGQVFDDFDVYRVS